MKIKISGMSMTCIELKKLIGRAQENDAHVTIRGFVECNSCSATTPLDMYVNGDFFHNAECPSSRPIFNLSKS